MHGASIFQPSLIFQIFGIFDLQHRQNGGGFRRLCTSRRRAEHMRNSNDENKNQRKSKQIKWMRMVGALNRRLGSLLVQTRDFPSVKFKKVKEINNSEN